MKNKFFISHSSAWKKSYVEPLTEALGRDLVVVDKYNFESGEDLWHEIRDKIDDCRFFVLLVSKEIAVKGGWVDREIGYVRELHDDKKVIFLPFIIDPDVEWNHEAVKTWIRNEKIVDKILQPKILARLLQNKLRRELEAQNPLLEERNHLFMGRSKDVEALEEQLVRHQTATPPVSPNTLIVSGLPHIGRKRLVREFLCQKILTKVDIGDLFVIPLSDTDDEWLFMKALNEKVFMYDDKEIDTVLTDSSARLDAIVRMLVRLNESKERFVIDDDNGIVKRDGRLAQWFVRLIKRPELQGSMIFNIAARFVPHMGFDDFNGRIIWHKVQEIDPKWLSLLFAKYAKIRDLDVSTEQCDSLTAEMKGYPEPVYHVVDRWKEGNSRSAMRALKNYMSGLDRDFEHIISEICKERPEAFDVLQLLSKVQFISLYDLTGIVGNTVTDSLDYLDQFGILTYWGGEAEYISLNSGLASFIGRAYAELPVPLSTRFEAYVAQQIEQLANDNNDLGGYIIAKRQQIVANPTSIPKESLIPSLVLKVMVETYYKGKNEQVVQMADQILNGYGRNLFRDMERTIIYWKCSALCRMPDRRFLKDVKYFSENSYSYNFLNGFYARHQKGGEERLKRAKDFYLKAHAISNQNDTEFSDSKLLHELWLVKEALHEPDAIDFAKACFERNPSNPFHVGAYFHSLVRSYRPDWNQLEELIVRMVNSYDKHRDIIAATMRAELVYRRSGDMARFKCDIEEILMSFPGDSFLYFPMRSLREFCAAQDAMPIYQDMKRRYPGIIERNDSYMLSSEK